MNIKRLNTALIALSLSAALAACGTTHTSRTAGEFVDDAGLTARVKTALARDKDVSALRINVDSYQGEVSLRGTVDNAEEAQRAVQLARSVEGVATVKNHLEVKP